MSPPFLPFHSDRDMKRGYEFWLRLKGLFRSALPFFFSLVAIFILSFPFHVPAQSELRLAVIMVCVYYWTIFRPHSMTAVHVFLLGLIIDLLISNPAGLVILILLLLHAMALTVRIFLIRFGFVFSWIVFFFFVFALLLFQWIATSIFTMVFFSFTPVLFVTVLSMGVYPLLFAMFSWVNMVILR